MMKPTKLVQSKRFLTLTLFLAIALIMANQIVLELVPLGVFASLAYILIGGYLLGSALFEDEQLIVRLSIGGLLFLGVLSVLSWLFILFNFYIGIFETGAILLATSFFLVIVANGRVIKEKMPSFLKPFGRKNQGEN